jgi:hypothetical protein
MNNYILNRTLSLLLPIQLILIGWAATAPEWIERNYSRGIYPIVSGFLRRGLGWIPFSVGDILYVLFFLWVLKGLWFLYETRFTPIKENLFRIGAYLSLIIFFFHFLWGLNYYREPLQKQLGIEKLTYDTIALQERTLMHIDKINKLHLLLAQNDSTEIQPIDNKKQTYKKATRFYKNFKYKGIDMHLKRKSVKHSLISVPLSYMGFSGYLNPFTGEAQVNRKIPGSIYPVTVTHEIAHQLGYASETEANYIGYLACINHDDLFFQYSGELMAVSYLIKEISLYNPDLAYQYYHQLNPGIQTNRQHIRDFWDSYKTWAKPVFQKTYDQYLKANRQSQGIQSYNAMVGYLVNDR